MTPLGNNPPHHTTEKAQGLQTERPLTWKTFEIRVEEGPLLHRSGRSRGQWVKRKINFHGEGLLDLADWKPIFLTFNCVFYYITMPKYKLKMKLSGLK